jgi:4-hydroxy-3-methylbut-2-enyl diphosphate reductase
MNRSGVREFQAPDIRVQHGELLVPTQVGDPARGPLPGPAAPLIAGSLRRKGWRCVLAPVPGLEEAGADSGGAVVYLATSSQRGGGAVALAAAASPSDRLAVAAARAAVEEWAAVTGTRRLLAAGSPWCSGAMRALDATWNAASEAAVQGRVMHICGELAAPPEALADLAARGVSAAAGLDGMAAGDIVVIPAHGVPPAVLAEAAARGLTVIDATCPLVTQAQERAARLAGRGDDLVLIGLAAGAAAGITGRAPGRATLVETAAGTAALQVADARRVSYLLQPGLPVESTAAVAAALRSRFPSARGQHPDSFCYAPSDRAQTVRAIAASCDLMLVLGDPDSADARQVSGLARDCGARTQVIAAVTDLTPALLSGVTAIGMAGSTSAPSDLAAQVTEALSGLGPLSVVRRQVISQVTPDQRVPAQAPALAPAQAPALPEAQTRAPGRSAPLTAPAVPGAVTLADDGLGLA